MSEAGAGTAVSPHGPEEGLAFLERLRQRIARSTGGLAVLVVDCGLVERVDGAWGYHVGDAVRQRAASLLRSEVLREDDFLGEVGRDDIACVLAGIEDPAVAALAAEKSLRALNVPLFLGEDEVFADPAIGIALYPAQGEEAEVLLQRAKAACAVARSRATRIAEHDDHTDAAARFLLESRLRGAIAQDGLELMFQPQYDLGLGQIMGVQGLLYWPGGGFVPADQAFAAAEASGLVTKLASLMLNAALRNVSEFRYNAGLDLRVSLQWPARALLDVELPDVVQAAVGTWRLRPGRLNIELSGTDVLREEPLAQETLRRLKALGIKLCLDDPHLAVSSLFLFSGMPFDEMRIDVAAARTAAAPAKAERVLKALVELARELRLFVFAVGVADDEEAARLKELGCDFMQGDYKGPALPPRDFIERYGFTE